MLLKSAKTGKRVFELKLNNVSQCVLPGNSKDEVEIQFHESDSVDKEEDMLVHVRLRFPTLPERGEDAEEEEPDMTPAETFQKNIMERGMIRSVTGNVIAEFTQDQGTFVTPRGRYAIQVMSLPASSPSSHPLLLRCIPPSCVCTEPSTTIRFPTKTSRVFIFSFVLTESVLRLSYPLRSRFAKATRSTLIWSYKQTAWSTPWR